MAVCKQPLQVSTTPSWLMPLEERKIIAHTSSTEVPAMGWGRHMVRLQAPYTNKTFSEDNTGKASCRSVLLQTPDLTQLKAMVAPDWPTRSTGTKLCPQQAKGAIADNRTEANTAQPQW